MIAWCRGGSHLFTPPPLLPRLQALPFLSQFHNIADSVEHELTEFAFYYRLQVIKQSLGPTPAQPSKAPAATSLPHT